MKKLLRYALPARHLLLNLLMAGGYLVPLYLFLSCNKEGPGGKAVIKGMVKHHDKPIPGAVVYIKYGSKESPGSNVTYYDRSVNANDSANYAFADLRRGDYYLFAVGYDSAGPYPVTGGIPVEIKNKTETVEADVQVFEP